MINSSLESPNRDELNGGKIIFLDDYKELLIILLQLLQSKPDVLMLLVLEKIIDRSKY
uniref:Uncharacterized protein n=1 Tax=Rhizophagus irregularis (strain DAOM 181602 / DAOM 197198 / MUCL 43194) TaxID=747089 RepID=U9URD0_RHIID